MAGCEIANRVAASVRLVANPSFTRGIRRVRIGRALSDCKSAARVTRPMSDASAPPASTRHAQCVAALDLPLQQFQTHLLYLPVEISTIGGFFAR